MIKADMDMQHFLACVESIYRHMHRTTAAKHQSTATDGRFTAVDEVKEYRVEITIEEDA